MSKKQVRFTTSFYNGEWMVYDEREVEAVCFCANTPTMNIDPKSRAKLIANLLNAAYALTDYAKL